MTKLGCAKYAKKDPAKAQHSFVTASSYLNDTFLSMVVISS